MSSSLNVVVIQCCSGYEVADNLHGLAQQLTQLPQTRPLLVVLPECFAAFGSEKSEPYRETVGDGQVQSWLAEQASQHGIWLLGGSLPLCHPSGKHVAASLLFNPKGVLQARYDKRHLFDVDIADQTGAYRESDTTYPGEQVVVTDVAGFRVGLAICYDLRFPEHFRAMASLGLDLILLPAAFTYLTGEAHWLPLLQARAIENQCYLAAANQAGHHPNGRHTWGHSLIIDPWGQVTGQLEWQLGMMSHQLSRSRLDEVRAAIPALQHRRV